VQPLTENTECRVATVVLADLSGFTALSEQLDAEEVTDILNRCFDVLESVVVTHGGIIEKYLGDGVVALFGFTPTRAAPAADAARAALALQAAVKSMREDGRLPSELGVHIGVATGPVTAAVIGGEARREFTVMGDTVACAGHLEHRSGAGQIFVGAETFAQTHTEFDYRPAAVEGGGAAPVYELLAEKPSRRLRRGSERRQATVLFADLLGLGARSGVREADREAGIVTRCLEELGATVVAHGGIVDKYVGDGLMALFGLPNAFEHAPRQAVRAAVEMRHRLARFCQREHVVEPLDLRVGVNTGLVIAGEIGGRLKRDFTAIGDTVNVAARLKDAASRGGICVGAETYRATRDDFEFRPLPPVSVKGKAHPVHAHAVVTAVGAAPSRPSVAAGRVVFSELVGRTRELATMQAQIDHLLSGRGGMISLSGEAGIGKSRLLAEVGRRLGTRDVTVLEASSLAVAQNLSFHPFASLLRRWVGIGEDEPAAAAGGKLLAAVAALVPDGTDDIYPFLARLMGIELHGAAAQRLASMEGNALERLIVKAVRDLILALAARQPLLLVFDDLHWADPSSVKLLEALVPLATDARVLFVAVYRPDCPDTAERVTAAARRDLRDRHVAIVLDGLDAADTDHLLRNLVDLTDLPPATRALIAERADGNPFYVEEVVQSLVDQGAVEFRDGRFRVTTVLDTVVIPATIQAVIMARVDRLEESARQILQVASVIGRSFHHRVIAAVLEREGGLTAELQELKDKQLVYAREARWAVVRGEPGQAEELEYVFKHALAQETIYGSLLRKTRKELHRRVADVIQALFGEHVADFCGMLAYHYTRAEDREKAHEYLFRAGEVAARSAAPSEALAFFQQAADMYAQLHGTGGEARRKAALEKGIGLALLNKGALPESIPHFDRALEHLGERVSKPGLASYAAFAVDMTALLAQLYLGLRRRRRVDDWEREREADQIMFNRSRAEIICDPVRLLFDSIAALRRFKESDTSQVDETCSIYASAAGMFCYSGLSFTVGRRILADARALARTGSVRDRFVCASMEFICDYLAGEWGDTHVVDDQLLQDALRCGQLWDADTYIGLYCDRLTRQGEFARARAMLARLDELERQYGYAFAGATRDGQTALLLIEERHLVEALPIATAYADARQEDSRRVHGLGIVAKIRALAGDGVQARKCLDVADAILRRSPPVSPWHRSAYVVARLRADVAALEQAGRAVPGLRRQAKRSARRALRVARQVAVPRTEVYQLVGRLYWALGSRDRALRWWGRSIDVGTTLHARPELARTFAVAARCLAQRPSLRLRGLDAAACAAQAAALFAAVGLPAEMAAASKVDAAE